MSVLSVSTGEEHGKTEQSSRPVWLTQGWLEPRLVVVTAVAIAASVIGQHAEWPAGLILVFNIISYAAGGIFGAKTAIESLLDRRIDVDMLMVLAALGAAAINQWNEGALLLFLFSLSNVLQDYAIGRSRSAIQSLFKLYPEEAKVRRGETIVILKLEELRVGDLVMIEPGERIPVDGIVRGGRSAVDQSPITGESMPVEKEVGDKVFAGTLNKQGVLDVEATQEATHTTLARIIKLVEEAQDSKAPTERFLEKFEQYYAMLIIAGTVLFIFIPPALGLSDFESNFYRAMVLMTVASPCALIISVPAAYISAIASAARSGVLFKGGAYLEQMASIKAIAFDKTGTLTIGEPRVTDVVSCCELGDDELLRIAAAVESRSEHPLAKAVVTAAHNRTLDIPTVEDFEAQPGQGVEGKVEGSTVKIGSLGYLTKDSGRKYYPPDVDGIRDRLEGQGKTVMGVVRPGVKRAICEECEFGLDSCGWMGLIAMADEVRPEARRVVSGLQALGVQVAMLTGDNQRVANNIASEIGIDEVFAGLMPEDKVTALKKLQAEHGGIAMVGDGVNDAPALATADVGIAMGAAGTDVALETADLVLMGDRIGMIEHAIELSKKARRVVWQNIAFSIGVIIMLIISTFAISLPLPLGVMGHEGSTVIVVLNGLIVLLLVPEVRRRRLARAAQMP